ncbi:type III secretion protein [Candidatus Aerophobetes bacterium]|uniref:Type III secretion protein n=1 Tax=Aerophobetes bacterium TaxID=2030807 RepID=A0A2A4WXD3_UNCAE|nr:MAG: type III secretion protein [Candidatus Aerophobetes bacterium]
MSYLDILSKIDHSWWGLLAIFVLSLMRLAPIMAIVPFLGKGVAPIMGRVALMLSLAVTFLPFIASHITTPVAFDIAFVQYSLKELVVGFVIGFFMTIPFLMAQTGGTIIDYLRGASIMRSQDPTMKSQSSPIGTFYNFMLILVFFQMNGPFIFFDALIKSYQLIPLTSFFNPELLHMKNAFWSQCFEIVTQVVTIGLQLSAPCLVAILMAELFLGIANRLAPQVQVSMLGMPLKSFLGIGVMWAGWFFILKQFSRHSYSWLHTVEHIIYQMKTMLF